MASTKHLDSLHWQPSRYLDSLQYSIDTNLLNSRKKDTTLNRLDKWSNDGVISVLTSQVAQKEMMQKDLEKALTYAATLTLEEKLLPLEREVLNKIEAIIFPEGAINSNQNNDVYIVFNAWKYRRILLTNDGGSKRQPRGIYGSKTELAELGIKIQKPEEALIEIEGRIKERDSLTILICSTYGLDLPPWVGTD
ncbi:hypothetical protein ACXHPE_14500 [Vibrio cincinnatiensis]